MDAALTLQQDRIRNSADEAFAESLARFRRIWAASSKSCGIFAIDHLAQLTELEGKAGDLSTRWSKTFKSAEWYKRSADANSDLTERTTRTPKPVSGKGRRDLQRLRERAGSCEPQLRGHAQTQMEEVVRDSFERARVLFAEAADHCGGVHG